MENIKLPKPKFESKTSLIDALKNRTSTRIMIDKAISLQDLSNLLWAGLGVNNHNGKTAPLLWNLSIYIALKSGVYLFNSNENILTQVLEEEIRNKIAYQEFVSNSPLILLYSIDKSEMSQDWVESTGGKNFFIGNQLGHVSQNVYLFAAINEMNTVVMSMFNKDYINEKLNLLDNNSIYLIQPISYSK